MLTDHFPELLGIRRLVVVVDAGLVEAPVRDVRHARHRRDVGHRVAGRAPSESKSEIELN